VFKALAKKIEEQNKHYKMQGSLSKKTYYQNLAKLTTIIGQDLNTGVNGGVG
jgi:hypothetical protein